jgi:hypothetical protein
VKVTLVRTYANSQGLWPSQVRQTTSDADGNYSFMNVEPGEYEIIPDGDVAEPPFFWFPTEIREVTKVAGEGLDEQFFERMQGGQHMLTVQVLDQNGDPMEGVQVKVAPFHDSREGGSGATAFDGRFTLANRWSGMYIASVTDAPPAGFRWDPPEERVMIMTANKMVTFRLVPE